MGEAESVAELSCRPSTFGGCCTGTGRTLGSVAGGVPTENEVGRSIRDTTSATPGVSSKVTYPTENQGNHDLNEK